MKGILTRVSLTATPPPSSSSTQDKGGGSGRMGLLAALDRTNTTTASTPPLIRATGGDPRPHPAAQGDRKNAKLELPHILVLIDDPKRSVIEPLSAKRAALRQLYDTPLMEGGGSLSAWLVDAKEDREAVFGAIDALYNTLDPANPLLFAMGDGNHSLATAKSCWEDIKATLSEEERATHPARFALVEIENIHDPALEFEPIHRTLFSLSKSDFEAEVAKVCARFETQEVDSLERINQLIDCGDGVQRFGYADGDGFAVYTLFGPHHSIAAGSLQMVIDSLLKQKQCTVDYIHGKDVTIKLGRKLATSP